MRWRRARSLCRSTLLSWQSWSNPTHLWDQVWDRSQGLSWQSYNPFYPGIDPRGYPTTGVGSIPGSWLLGSGLGCAGSQPGLHPSTHIVTLIHTLLACPPLPIPILLASCPLLHGNTYWPSSESPSIPGVPALAPSLAFLLGITARLPRSLSGCGDMQRGISVSFRYQIQYQFIFSNRNCMTS